MSNVPAHLIEETVGLCHTIKLMFVLFQKIHVALFWDKLQQLIRGRKEKQENTFSFVCTCQGSGNVGNMRKHRSEF